MRILLDECLPRKLKKDLPGHEARTVPEAGWAGIKNGRLLRLAESAFDVFLTVDQNVEYQQNLAAYNIAIVVLVSNDIRFRALQPFMPAVIQVLETIKPLDLVHISGESDND